MHNVCTAHRFIGRAYAYTGIHMAVVTFSPQTDMIREVLRERFGPELAMQVRVCVS